MKNDNKKLPVKSLPEKVMDAFELPKSKTGMVTELNITGIHQATIEGHRGIIEYTDTVIKLNTPKFVMKLCGHQLEITGVAEEYITIKGVITGVEYIF